MDQGNGMKNFVKSQIAQTLCFPKDMPELLHNFALGVREFVIGHQDFSRLGSWNDAKFCELANLTHRSEIKLYFEWDILQSESQYDVNWARFKALPFQNFDAVRVLDLGVLDFLVERSFYFFHVLLEAGFHNEVAVTALLSLYGPRIKRMILSKELPLAVIGNYVKKWPLLEIEILLCTPILLFYSPRSLLQPIMKDQAWVTSEKMELQALAASQESPHRGFMIRENQHGTFMYHPKYLFLLDKLKLLLALDHPDLIFAIDLRMMEDANLRSLIMQKIATFMIEVGSNFLSSTQIELKEEVALNLCQEIITLFPMEVMRAFFERNKTDVLFTKLKNQHLLPDDDRHIFVGDILDRAPGKFLVLQIKGKNILKIGDHILLKSPLGKKVELSLTQLENLQGQSMTAAHPGDLVRINFVKNMVAQSTVFIM